MSRLSPVSVLAALVSISSIVPSHAQLYDQIIQTTYGPVQGYQYFNQSQLETYFNRSTSYVAAFLGIPYAADTAYENRWKAPQPREPWNETLNASTFGPACPVTHANSYSEDCLSLNIWTNAATANASHPVLLWNQGSDESSDNTWWYGGGMALKDIIVVTFNRRDDAFGYLAHPELNAEGFEATGYNTSGTYGILDELEVLKWIQKNIAQFGGDPTKVTVAGQSFGSGQVYHAVNSPLFSGYFRAAISQSGIRYPYDTLLAGLATSYVNMSTAVENGLNYTAAHNVSSIAELRKLSTAELLVGSGDRVGNESIWWVTALSAGYPLKFKPAFDGYAIPMRYTDQLHAGPGNDVPLMTGNTRDESGAELTTSYTVAEYNEYIPLKYGNLTSRYLELYPAGNSTDTASTAWRKAATDNSLVSSWAFGTKWVKTAKSPFYTYYWDHSPPGQDQGAFHQSEIMYVMNALYANTDKYTFTEYDYYLGEVMSSYWTNFIKHLDPNGVATSTGSNLTHWVPNDGESQTVMRVGDGFGATKIAEKEKVTLIMEYFAQQSPY
jgi:carboxylesterase 2